MKKFFIAVFTFVFICIIFVIYDYNACFKDFQKRIGGVSADSKNIPFEYTFNIISFDKVWKNLFYNNYFFSKRRKIEADSNKAPVIVFGCSCAAGMYLNDFETFSYKLSKAANRTVYDRAFGGFGLSNMFYQVSQPLFYNTIDSNQTPEYAVYIYLPHHLSLIYNSSYLYNGKAYWGYDVKNGKLKQHNSLFLQLSRFYTWRCILEKYILPNCVLNYKNNDKNFDLVKLFFEESRAELKKRYPDIKFVILKYPYELGGRSNKDTYYNSRWKELKEEGFIVINLKDYFKNDDILSKKYIYEDGHPKTTTWDVVCEQLAKDLKL